MTIQFPANPQIGDQFTDFETNITYTWTGEYWSAQGPGDGIGATGATAQPVLVQLVQRVLLDPQVYGCNWYWFNWCYWYFWTYWFYWTYRTNWTSWWSYRCNWYWFNRFNRCYRS